MKTLHDFPSIEKAISDSGFIRVRDGKYKNGVVIESEMVECIKSGILHLVQKDDIMYAVLPITIELMIGHPVYE